MVAVATKGPKFTHWRTGMELISAFTGLNLGEDQDSRDVIRSLCQRDTRLDKYVGELYASDKAALFVRAAEWNWVHAGRPYYKLWPGMAEALCHTRLDIDSKAFFPPYRSFSVMLAKGNTAETLNETLLVQAKSGDELRSGNNPEVVKELERKYGARVLWEVSIYANQCAGYDNFPIHLVQGEKIEDAVQRLSEILAREDPGGYIPRSFSLAIAVAFFGVDNHEVVCPDIKKQIIDCKCRPKLRKMREENAMKKHAREVAKCKGWLVGSEIDLPRPEVINHGDVRHGAGTELTAGHIRSGHMRMQPCGLGLKDRKLIFVPPTVVRPDLPFRQTHGYRIKGNAA